MAQIPVLVEKAPDPAKKGIFGGEKNTEVRLFEVSALREQIDRLRVDMEELFAAKDTNSAYTLKAIDVGVEVSAEGGISLIGTAKFGGKGSFVLTFERR